MLDRASPRKPKWHKLVWRSLRDLHLLVMYLQIKREKEIC
jgi:hypothetical protein